MLKNLKYNLVWKRLYYVSQKLSGFNSIQRLLPLDKNIGIYTITIGNNAGGIYNNITIGTGNNTGSYTTNNNIAIGNNAGSYTANNITIGYNADTTTTGSYTANIHSYNADSYTTNLGNYRHYNTYIHG